ncbi:MAG: ATPase F0F1 [Faecalibacterium sp.]
MKSIAKALEDLVWVGQLGLSLMMPLLLLMLLCYWLTTQMGVGVWVYLPGFLLGIGAGISSFASFWNLMKKKHLGKQKDKEFPQAISFNQHD